MINHLNPDFSDVPGRRKQAKLYKSATSNLDAHIDVSIITPYYNTEDYFIETVNSLKAQSLQNWEWVIVDDGSTDADSVRRLHDIASGDQRIKIFRQENAGPAAARNTAFRHSSGRYLCLLDSDDMIEPTYMEKCVWFLDSNPDFAFCNSWSVVFGENEFLWAQGFERGKECLQANSGPPISVIRSCAYDAVGGFDESIRFGHEDWDFWLSMANAGHWGYTLPEYLQWYRKRASGRFEQIMRSGNTNDEFEKYIKKKYSNLEKNFPSPQRRHPQPFESIETVASVRNPLANKDATGRRVMFLVPWMVTGGADRVNLDLIEGLVNQDYDVTVCATLYTKHDWKHRFGELTPDVFVLPDFLHQSDYPRFLSYLIASRKIDVVVITGSTIGYLLLPYLRAHSSGAAFVDLCHVEEPHWQNGGHPRFSVGYQEALDLNIVTTSHLACWMEERGADRSRIRLLYTGVNEREKSALLAQRGSERAELGVSDDVPLIIFAGRICQQKRPALLAEILKATQEAGLKFHALIVGDGELRSMLEGLIQKYQLQSHVTMLGAQPHERWLSLLAASDIFLLPSDYEGISVALLEAMAAGVVPVVSYVGGQEELVESDAGFLIPHGDEECSRYVETMRFLLTNPERCQIMGERCRVLVSSRFSKKITLSTFEAILDESIHLATSSPRTISSLGLAREQATFAMEFNRLSNVADWLWAQNHRHGKSHDLPLSAAGVLFMLVNVANSTKTGRLILNNSFVRFIGRRFKIWLKGRMGASV